MVPLNSEAFETVRTRLRSSSAWVTIHSEGFVGLVAEIVGSRHMARMFCREAGFLSATAAESRIEARWAPWYSKHRTIKLFNM